MRHKKKEKHSAYFINYLLTFLAKLFENYMILISSSEFYNFLAKWKIVFYTTLPFVCCLLFSLHFYSFKLSLAVKLINFKISFALLNSHKSMTRRRKSTQCVLFIIASVLICIRVICHTIVPDFTSSCNVRCQFARSSCNYVNTLHSSHFALPELCPRMYATAYSVEVYQFELKN